MPCSQNCHFQKKEKKNANIKSIFVVTLLHDGNSHWRSSKAVFIAPFSSFSFFNRTDSTNWFPASIFPFDLFFLRQLRIVARSCQLGSDELSSINDLRRGFKSCATRNLGVFFTVRITFLIYNRGIIPARINERNDWRDGSRCADWWNYRRLRIELERVNKECDVCRVV